MTDHFISEILDNYYGNKPAPLPEGVVPVDEDDGLACECFDHRPKKGWKGKLPVKLDGNNWPLDFAAKMLGCSEKDLRDLIRIIGLKPAGTMKMSSYRRSGRHPRAYDASKLVRIWQGIQNIIDDLEDD